VVDQGEAVDVYADALELYNTVTFKGGSQEDFDQRKLERLKHWAKINDGQHFATYATMARKALATLPLSEEQLDDLARSCAGPWVSEENLEGYKRGPTTI